jgi:hypothetical protein
LSVNFVLLILLFLCAAHLGIVSARILTRNGRFPTPA